MADDWRGLDSTPKILDFPSPKGLRQGGDGGNSGGMEARVAKLETDVEYIKRDVSQLAGDMRDVRDRMTRLETRVDHLPSKGFIVTCSSVTLVLLGALFTLAPKLQALLGIMH